MKLGAAILIALSCACGALYQRDDAGASVDVHVKGAPAAAVVAHVEAVFAEEARAAGIVYEPVETLVVEWHAPGEVFRVGALADGTPYYIEGETPDGHHTRVSSVGLLVHELAHVAFFRLTGDGDANHETPPGPWTAETNAMIERVKARVEADGGP